MAAESGKGVRQRCAFFLFIFSVSPYIVFVGGTTLSPPLFTFVHRTKGTRGFGCSDSVDRPSAGYAAGIPTSVSAMPE